MRCKKDNCTGRLQANCTEPCAICPECRSVNCLSCNAIHERQSCKQYRKSMQPEAPPGQRKAQNTAFAPPPAAGPEKSPRRAPAPAAPPAAASDDDDSEKHVVCKVDGCDGQAFVGKEDAMFRCPLCGHYSCLKCEAVHESMTCAEYQANKDSVSPPVHKLNGQTEEDDDEVEDEEVQREPPADDDAEGMIVECRYLDCKGYAYVVRTATTAQCELCKHWTCVSCEACHESQTCAQYKGIEIPEENAAPEPAINGKRRGIISGVLSKIGNFMSGGPSAEEGPPTQIPYAGRPADNSKFDPGTVSGARGHRDYKKVPETAWRNGESGMPLQSKYQGNCAVSCDACSHRQYDHMAKECEHLLCSQCIQESIKNATVHGSVSCPAKAEDLQPCTGHLQKEELDELFSRKIFKTTKNKDWCDTKCFDERCSHAFRRKRGVQFFICPLCRRENCADCCAVHQGMTCADYIKKFVENLDKGNLEDPEEKKKRLQELTALYEQPSIQTSKEFECSICFVEVEPGKGIVLRNCHHQVCEQCLADTAKNSPVAEVLCPCKSDDADCQMPVLDSDLRACLSEEDYAALQERGLREAENTSKEPSFHCKTPDCKGWCLYERDVEDFDCPVCGQRNCLRCEAIHKDVTCAEYQADLKRRAENDAAARASLNFLEEMLKTEQAMRCPQCRVVIIKRSGCDFMVCTSCKTQLCWATKGARWGPGGQGDTSGGCRCGVNGVRCHPKCTTCH